MIKDEMHGVEVKKILWVNCNGAAVNAATIR